MSMREKRRFRFPAPFGVRTACRFPVPDQIFYPETLGVRRAGTWVALDPEWIAPLLAAAVRAGATRMMRWPPTQAAGGSRVRVVARPP